MPCPACNDRDDPRDQPKMPPGFNIDVDADDDGTRQ
jgi:hypothetical protein